MKTTLSFVACAVAILLLLVWGIDGCNNSRQVTRERDTLARTNTTLTRERDSLKRAIEAAKAVTVTVEVNTGKQRNRKK